MLKTLQAAHQSQVITIFAAFCCALFSVSFFLSAKAQAKTIYRNLLDVSATVRIGDAAVIVTVDKRAHNPYLVASGLADHPNPMPWLRNKLLKITFA